MAEDHSGSKSQTERPTDATPANVGKKESDRTVPQRGNPLRGPPFQAPKKKHRHQYKPPEMSITDGINQLGMCSVNKLNCYKTNLRGDWTNSVGWLTQAVGKLPPLWKDAHLQIAQASMLSALQKPAVWIRKKPELLDTVTKLKVSNVWTNNREWLVFHTIAMVIVHKRNGW